MQNEFNAITQSGAISLDKFDINLVNANVQSYGVECALDRILKDNNCARVYNDGSRPMQTINYSYKINIVKYNYILTTFREELTPERYDFYFNALKDNHEDNLKYEADNPPVIYKKTKSKARAKKASFKSTDIFTGETTIDGKIKLTSAERKKINRIGAITNLKFKMKSHD